MGDSWSIWLERFVEQTDGQSPLPAPNSTPSSSLVADRDPSRLLALALARLAAGHHVFLANPDWSPSQWQKAISLSTPSEVIGAPPTLPKEESRLSIAVSEEAKFIKETLRELPVLWIPTGGSGGNIRFAAHTLTTLKSAAAAIPAALGQKEHHSVSVLPAHHISGIMPTLRALATGGSVRFAEWRALERGELSPELLSRRTLSLVPTQLQRLLETPHGADYLAHADAILLGGSLCPVALLDRARRLRLPIAPCYGMTETAAAVTITPPRHFLGGDTTLGLPLPHVHILVRENNGLPAAPGHEGQLIVMADSLCRALLPGGLVSAREGYATGDRGSLDRSGCLRIHGRMDAIIITGGEKVDPILVEQALYHTGLIADCTVCGIEDPQWGQTVAAIVVPKAPPLSEHTLRQHLKDRLSPIQMPKRWLIRSELPRSQNGKLDSKAVQALFFA